jgi:colanic acid biosynthesis glycosyl transferase WcaI
LTAYRTEQDIGDEPVVMYAGNVGFSQSLGLVLAAAAALPETTFVINGDGAARAVLAQQAVGLSNVRFVGYQPKDRLPEVLASADLHVVPLRAGLGNVSVPSKTYSILAAGRPVLAAIDPATEVPRMIEASGAGRVVPPDDVVAFVAAIREMLSDRTALAAQGAAGRRYVERAASPRAVAAAYVDVIEGLRSCQRVGGPNR